MGASNISLESNQKVEFCQKQLKALGNVLGECNYVIGFGIEKFILHSRSSFSIELLQELFI